MGQQVHCALLYRNNKGQSQSLPLYRINVRKINAILLWACHLLTTTAEEYIPQADTMRILQEQGFATAVLREKTRPPVERKKDKVSAANGQFISITFVERGHPSCPNEFLNIHQ